VPDYDPDHIYDQCANSFFKYAAFPSSMERLNKTQSYVYPKIRAPLTVHRWLIMTTCSKTRTRRTCEYEFYSHNNSITAQLSY
jgi:hypothetical protein